VRGKGHDLLEMWAIPNSRFFALWPLASRVNSPKIWVETYLANLQWNFCETMGPFFWGVPPLVALRRTWFSGESRVALSLIEGIYICTTNWGVGFVYDEKSLENPF
jgi:hypothetical protein